MVCGGHWSTDSMRCHLACHMKRKTRLGWKDAILWLKVGCANPECTVKAQVSGEGCLGAFRACPRLPYNKGRPPIPRRTGRGPMRSSEGVARTTAGSVARPMGTACSAPDHGAVTRQRHGPIYRHAMRSRAATRLSHVQGNVAIKGILLLYRWGEAGVSPTGRSRAVGSAMWRPSYASILHPSNVWPPLPAHDILDTVPCPVRG